MKPGYQTSEFWMKLIGVVQFPIFLMFGYQLADTQGLADAIATIASAAVSISASISYLISRFKLKSQKP